ncbi:MAG TPA: hypothetical protein PK867_09805 [Pirellulales bacterium]|nr:hypothetical protein [Pirellulales bacterium]
MATMPGMNADVYWGDPDKPDPDWRDHPIPDADEDDDSYSEDATRGRKAWVCGVLGVDPSFLDDASDGDDDDEEDAANEPD